MWEKLNGLYGTRLRPCKTSHCYGMARPRLRLIEWQIDQALECSESGFKAFLSRPLGVWCDARFSAVMACDV
jgi:hypothetical protein